MKWCFKLFVLGDVNGNFELLNQFIDREIRHNPKLRDMAVEWRKRWDRLDVEIIQCGDFDYFGLNYDRKKGARGEINNEIDFLVSKRARIFWCPGDREDHNRLRELYFQDHYDVMHEVDKDVVACDFGSLFFFARNHYILFCGGAEAEDDQWHNAMMDAGRGATSGGIKEEDIESVEMEMKGKYHFNYEIVISHTAPALFGLHNRIGKAWDSLGPQPSSKKLDRILLSVKPKRWYFSHPRKHIRGMTKGCCWEGLAPLGEPGGWTSLFLKGELKTSHPEYFL